MTWIKLDQGFPEHPKVIDAGPLAAWLHVRALGYCNRNLTDGAISHAIARELAPGKRGQALVRRLVAAGLWEMTRTGYAIHDFLEYQPSRADVLDLRAKKAEAGRAGGLAKARQRAKQTAGTAPGEPLPEGAAEPKPVPSPVPVPGAIAPVPPEDAARSSSQVRREGVHHVGAMAQRIAAAAGAH